MAVEDTPVAVNGTIETPYRLDQTQTITACKAVTKQIAERNRQMEAEEPRKNLLKELDESEQDEEDTVGEDPVWLICTTKRHVVDQKRLKPSKIAVPHPFHTSPNLTICLITTDPQRLYKDIIDHPSFPKALSSQITRVIGLSKLKTKYKSFEARRQLFAEHEVFLADDRIITYLPQALGKVFYKSGAKRPVPVSIAAPRAKDENGKKIKLDPAKLRRPAGVDGGRGGAHPASVAREIEKALNSALVHLTPGTNTAVKVGTARQSPEMLCENIEAVVNGLTERFITKGWSNVRAIHLKGHTTLALPIWLASELWVEEGDVLEEKRHMGKKKPRAIESNDAEPAIEGQTQSPLSQKRKANETGKPTASRHAKKKRKAEVSDDVNTEAVRRKERMKKQKDSVLAEVGDVL